MDTEHRFILILALLCIIFLCIVSLVLFIALWEFHIILAWLIFSLLALMFLLVTGIIANEQFLRHRRVKYHNELPLNGKGIPLYIPQEMKQYQLTEMHHDQG